MKIKTILRNTDNVELFDAEVNDLLAEGWRLVKREVLPGMNYNADNWARRALYAELVQLDPEPARPPHVKHFEALRDIKAACQRVPIEECHAGRCPMADWCAQLDKDPTDWVLPEKEAPTS